MLPEIVLRPGRRTAGRVGHPGGCLERRTGCDREDGSFMTRFVRAPYAHWSHKVQRGAPVAQASSEISRLKALEKSSDVT